MHVIKVLIVDDSAVVRQTYTSMLESDPGIKVIATASDPYIAVQKIQRERPDVITLDIEMPRMDGLTFLKKIMRQAPMPVIVITNQTSRGAEVALKALEMGAVDVMTKPDISTAHIQEESRINLIDKVKSAYTAKRNGRKAELSNTHEAAITSIPTKPNPLRSGTFSSNTIIGIGASTGGTEAIKSILDALPSHMPPILIVQHMPAKFTESFAKRLHDTSLLTVKEAEDNEEVKPNHVYVAPGGRHMSIKTVQGPTRILITDGELVNRHRPSVNVLFHSLAEMKGKHAIGIMLTGMGDDGAKGMLAMHQQGAYTIAQDEATCIVFGMPHKAILAGGVSKILPLHEIANDVFERVMG